MFLIFHIRFTHVLLKTHLPSVNIYTRARADTEFNTLLCLKEFSLIEYLYLQVCTCSLSESFTTTESDCSEMDVCVCVVRFTVVVNSRKVTYCPEGNCVENISLCVHSTRYRQSPVSLRQCQFITSI